MSNRLPHPQGAFDRVEMRVQELLHGHRFIQEQEPFMIVLETLAVCAAQPLGSVQASEGAHEEIKYALPHRKKMRFLLFQDRHLERIIQDDTVPNNQKWSVWKTRVNRQFHGEDTKQDAFAYLDQEDRFDGDINALVQAVRLLQSCELDVMHNRRWTSRFLAVTGPDMICTDVKESRTGWSPDRRFFGRGGELVYLMLNRAELAPDVNDLVQRRLLDPDDPMNKIALALSTPSDDTASTTTIGYLPQLHMPAYDRMAKDWHAVLSCGWLPDGHLFEPLFRVTGLNLVSYLSERAQTEIGTERPEPIVVDLTDGANMQMRNSAKQSLSLHRDNANGAVRAFVEGTLAQNERWQMAVDRSDPGLAREAIKQSFYCDLENDHPATPEELREQLIAAALGREKNNIDKYLLPLSRASGLVTSRQRVGAWFALDDPMLFALVLANVEKTIELREFVARLYDRYRLVIGPEEARHAFGRMQTEQYEENLAALEARLTRLALTERLSDDCAFVTNPYR